jgi:hypothetical protein
MFRVIWFVAIFLVFVPFTVSSFAEPTQKEKLIHADKNKDGVVTGREMKMEKTWEQEKRAAWKTVKSKVDTSAEIKYDTNADGYLEASEAKEYLKDKSRLIETSGRAKVDSSIEKEYDSDNDGIISAKEAEALKEDLKD